MSKWVSIIVLILILLVGSSCLFVVDEREYVVVSQFGNPVRVIKSPGLKIKYPYPFQSVLRFDNRFWVFESPLQEFLSISKKNIMASSFLLWKIDDPKKFLQTVFDKKGAESRLQDMVSAQLGAALGKVELTAFITTYLDDYQAETILVEVAKKCQEIALRDYGIFIKDVRLQQMDFPERNRDSVFQRMKSERARISMKFRSEGEEEGLKIRAEAAKEKTRIASEAYKIAQASKGEGEAESTRIYAASLNKNPQFYQFLRTMEAYRSFLNDKTVMILPLNSDIFRLLYDSNYIYGEEGLK
jgi:membrane protease subunit HflC